jgi:hypothetical protein
MFFGTQGCQLNAKAYAHALLVGDWGYWATGHRLCLRSCVLVDVVKSAIFAIMFANSISDRHLQVVGVVAEHSAQIGRKLGGDSHALSTISSRGT